MKTIYDVPIILRREIEALMVKPFIDAFEKELGHEKTYEIVKKSSSTSPLKKVWNMRSSSEEMTCRQSVCRWNPGHRTVP